MKRSSQSIAHLILFAILLTSGCAVTRVTSDPSGAKVYNASGVRQCGTVLRGFKPYDNVQGTYRGVTPCSYTRWFPFDYDNVRVVWQDGTSTPWEIQHAKYLGLGYGNTPRTDANFKFFFKKDSPSRHTEPLSN